MVEVLKSLIDLIIQFINELSKFEIELTPGNYVSVLVLVIGFTAVVLILYFVFSGLGFIGKGDDE